MWRSIASATLNLVLIALVLVASVILWGRSEYKGAGPLAEGVCVEVPKGGTLTRVAEQLERKGAIESATIFKIGVKYQDKATAIKHGSFLIEPNASMEEIADVITRGGANTCGAEMVYVVGVSRFLTLYRKMDPATGEMTEIFRFEAGQETPEGYEAALNDSGLRHRVSIAEGATSWQITNALSQIASLKGEISSVPAEGSLAPQSYEFAGGEARSDLIALMQQRQAQILAEAWANRSDQTQVSTPQEALILASIIEKETAVAEERRIVSSVFTNRLRQGIRLQTDPTVIYGITKGEGVLGRGLRRSELNKPTAYNTYVIEGLPPTPIANPGKAAIEAAVNPAETKFLFFVADGTGGHVFAETLRDHQRNVAKWRAIEEQQSN